MFLLSLIALAAGAGACQWLDQNPRTHKIVDGLVMGLMLALLGGVLASDILPSTGWQALAWLGAGFAAPFLLEHGFKRFAREAHLLTLGVGLAGLMLHAAIDGAALAPTANLAEPHHSHWLGWAIVLHRIPVGMMTWWLLGPQFGWKPAVAALLSIGAFTYLGYFAADQAIAAGHHSLGWVEAFVTGSLLHVILNKRHADHQH